MINIMIIIHIRSCASIISNFYLTFYPDKRCTLSFAKQLRLWSFTKIECRDDLVQWLWNIHKGFAAERPHSQNDLKEQLLIAFLSWIPRTVPDGGYRFSGSKIKAVLS